LILLYDDNGISIDGDVQGWFSDDTEKRFESYGWNVSRVDGHDADAVSQAIASAKAQAGEEGGKPTLICCKTIIGKGAPSKAGGHDVHGAPLGAVEIAAAREALQWPYAAFEIPDYVYTAWDAKGRGAELEAQWEQVYSSYAQSYPAKAAEFTRRIAWDLPAAFSENIAEVFNRIAAHESPVATRKASQMALDALSPLLPEFLGGSADLTGSNLTNFKGCTVLKPNQWGNHISYGVREFGMAAMMNGVALHGGFLPYGGTFLTFSDYSRNAIRMAALMKLRVIHVFTHDSIGLGEDGPTHQSVEHIPSLRIIPNLDVWRPADALETAVAWTCSVERRDGPSALALTRQNLPSLGGDANRVSDIVRGGYILAEAAQPKAVIIATGSEVEIALSAHRFLLEQGLATRVVSMPCTHVFERQSKEYQQAVLPQSLPAVAVEAAQMDGWYKYVGREGKVVGMHSYGESAPAKVLYEYFGITKEAVVRAVQEVTAQNS
jgi:transketolase